MKLFLRYLLSSVLLSLYGAAALAVPYTPSNDAQVVERLRDAVLSSADKQFRLARAGLRQHPTYLPLAIKVAQEAIELGRQNGDPRYFGYAQAALNPWWQRADEPDEVALLRAILWQGQHRFDEAAALLVKRFVETPAAQALQAQAQITLAAIYQVQGRYSAAEQACQVAGNLGATLYAEACLIDLDGLRGKLASSMNRFQSLADTIIAHQAKVPAWLMLMRAEAAARAGDKPAAERFYRSALAVNPDSYTKAAYADHLLRDQRYAEVVALLKNDERVDSLLLRLAIALRATHGATFPTVVSALQARFEAAHLRGDVAHRREEARFNLSVLNQAQSALDLARLNWTIQKEPADALLLVEAAIAAHQPTAAEPVKTFVNANGLQDVRLTLNAL